MKKSYVKLLKCMTQNKFNIYYSKKEAPPLWERLLSWNL